MTSRQKKIIIFLLLIVVVLGGLFAWKYFNDEKGSEDLAPGELDRPFTKEERQEILNGLAPRGAQPKTSLSVTEQKVVDSLAPQSNVTSPKVQNSYRYTPPPPLSSRDQSILNSMAPTSN